ncbi:coiled-coil domain-containing protein-domain-containing protein [Aspergillus venezuelensis]
MPLFPMGTGVQNDQKDLPTEEPDKDTTPSTSTIPHTTLIKNRRKRYLDLHPEYFSADLELADPLLYDRLIRRFQTPAEREAEGRAKGFSGVLQADLLRSEAKFDALNHPDPHALFTYARGENGEILAEERDEVPASKEEGEKAWRWEMTMRFLRGEDGDFDYTTIDGDEGLDESADEMERWFDSEEPEWVVDRDGDGEGQARGGDVKSRLTGETGIQDF